jgi:hypothetical protein
MAKPPVNDVKKALARLARVSQKDVKIKEEEEPAGDYLTAADALDVVHAGAVLTNWITG